MRNAAQGAAYLVSAEIVMRISDREVRLMRRKYRASSSPVVAPSVAREVGRTVRPVRPARSVVGGLSAVVAAPSFVRIRIRIGNEDVNTLSRKCREAALNTRDAN
jgi:hypothetical protein